MKPLQKRLRTSVWGILIPWHRIFKISILTAQQKLDIIKRVSSNITSMIFTFHYIAMRCLSILSSICIA